MRISRIWWRRVENVASIPDKIRHSLESDKSVLLECESDIPWKNEFYEKMYEEISAVSADKSIVSVCAAGIPDPAVYVLNHLCSPAAREKYWPDETIAQFLASQDEITLNSKIIRVQDVRDRERAAAWLKFIKEYSEESKKYDRPHALFIIELLSDVGELPQNEYVDFVKYADSEFDRYIFCMSILSDNKRHITVKKYMAELACLLGGTDAEYCGAFALCGDELLYSPAACAKRLRDCVRSDRRFFPVISPQDMESCVVQAQIKAFFPELEKTRMNFIKEKYSAISGCLPVQNCFGELITVPYGLEFSDLISISKNDRKGFSDSDRDMLKKCKELRNKLAHKSILTADEIAFITAQS